MCNCDVQGIFIAYVLVADLCVTGNVRETSLRDMFAVCNRHVLKTFSSNVQDLFFTCVLLLTLGVAGKFQGP